MAGQKTERTARRRRASRRGSGAASYLVIVAFLVGAALVHLSWPIPVWVLGVYVLASVVCAIVYAVDKSRARSGGRRIPEQTLHMLEFLGGWPGAIVAQQMLRHKTQKASFRVAFWAMVVTNVVVFVLLTTPFVQAGPGA